MAEDNSISSLRSRVSALVEQEGALLTRAFELSRAGGDRRGVDALFARVQAIQVERNSLKKQIGNVLGTQRLHVASEVWRPGIYDYRNQADGEVIRVRVATGPLGLQVLFPGRTKAASIETLNGTFDGPLAVDDAAAHPEPGSVGSAEKPPPRKQPGARGRTGKKNPA
jgi:hypothetical protein